jgi:osmotically-inducible protein OsmY
MQREINSNMIGPGQASLFRSSDEIKRDIEELIRENDAIYPKDIDVFVENGIVTLKGSVRDEEALQQTLRAAGDVLGVLDIESELEIVQ